MHHANMYIQLELNKLRNTCQHATARIAMATTLADVIQAQSIAVKPDIRAIAKSLPEYRAIGLAAERKATDLVVAQLKQLSELDPVTRETKYGYLRSREWIRLQGYYPRLLQQTLVAAQKLL